MMTEFTQSPLTTFDSEIDSLSYYLFDSDEDQEEYDKQGVGEQVKTENETNMLSSSVSSTSSACTMASTPHTTATTNELLMNRMTESVDQNKLIRESNRKQSGAKVDRRTAKLITERKRRDRINALLENLRTLILKLLHKNPRHHRKLEKADVLQLVVSFLKRELNQSRRSTNQVVGVDTNSASLNLPHSTIQHKPDSNVPKYATQPGSNSSLILTHNSDHSPLIPRQLATNDLYSCSDQMLCADTTHPQYLAAHNTHEYVNSANEAHNANGGWGSNVHAYNHSVNPPMLRRPFGLLNKHHQQRGLRLINGTQNTIISHYEKDSDFISDQDSTGQQSAKRILRHLAQSYNEANHDIENYPHCMKFDDLMSNYTHNLNHLHYSNNENMGDRQTTVTQQQLSHSQGLDVHSQSLWRPYV